MERPKRFWVEFIPTLVVMGLGIQMQRTFGRLNWDTVFGGVLIVALVNVTLVLFVPGKKISVWYLVPSVSVWLLAMKLMSMSAQMNRRPTLWYWAIFTIGCYAIEKVARSRKVV